MKRACGTARPILNSCLEESQHDHGLHSSHEDGRRRRLRSCESGGTDTMDRDEKSQVPSEACQARDARIERMGQSRGNYVEKTGCWSSELKYSEQYHESRNICGDMMQSKDANVEAALRGENVPEGASATALFQPQGGVEGLCRSQTSTRAGCDGTGVCSRMA
jgi:hypothetical protein